MKFKGIIFVVLISLLAFAKESEELVIRVGDSVLAVRNHLGEPNIEFPLNGQLVQDYGHYIITSRNGVVTAIKKREDVKPVVDLTKGEKPPAPSFKALMEKARTGDAEAQYCVAYCYQSGEIMDKNMDEAIRWYTLAAMQGHMASQHNLGLIYMKGDGVPQDYEQAYTWAVLAADNGNNELEKRLRSQVTADQKATAFVRSQRIRDGLEESPYGYPDETTAIAKTKAKDETTAE